MGVLSQSGPPSGVAAAPDPLTPVSQPGRFVSRYERHTMGFLTVVSVVGGLAVREVAGRSVSHLNSLMDDQQVGLKSLPAPTATALSGDYDDSLANAAENAIGGDKAS
jgi:hypothetical protein